MLCSLDLESSFGVYSHSKLSPRCSKKARKSNERQTPLTRFCVGELWTMAVSYTYTTPLL